ncbi:YB-like 1 protein [Heterostelium album PN500]|uniref:YB-like 1 protein n=1 Tax=Heterostelium pallidum (strain ATCC 26659 / Pp 5 / PN500) TaxID=670386 RepID=D3BED0_HETP5|nr:YB-like 1 protein [Heterostelium album PN500]EFA80261.1 YB-like 1 protein [Heterostelium album PN500]|eukprot:XP_020432381.1 YB-like 1 protein [Heterostelium album PN500]
MSENSDLPNAILARIIKQALPENVQIANESKLALAKAAKVWIHYLTACSIDICQNAGRSTLSGKDVIAALDEIDFSQFIEPLEEFIAVTKKEKESKEKENKDSKEKDTSSKDKDSKDNKDKDSKDSKDKDTTSTSTSTSSSTSKDKK